MALLEVQDLHAGYGRTDVLRDVSLSLDRGQIVSLLGTNGSGKSALIRAISGLVRVSSGSVLLDGLPVGGLAPHRVVRLGVAQVPEGRLMFTNMSVSESLQLGGYSTSKRRRRELTEQAYERFPRLRERRSVRAGSLSGGEQQMLAIARALMSDPKVILLDEPTLGLAPIITEELGRSLRSLAEGGLAVLVSDENADRGLRWSDQAVVIHAGQVTLVGDSVSLRVGHDVRHAYFGDTHEAGTKGPLASPSRIPARNEVGDKPQV